MAALSELAEAVVKVAVMMVEAAEAARAAGVTVTAVEAMAAAAEVGVRVEVAAEMAEVARGAVVAKVEGKVAVGGAEMVVLAAIWGTSPGGLVGEMVVSQGVAARVVEVMDSVAEA